MAMPRARQMEPTMRLKSSALRAVKMGRHPMSFCCENLFVQRGSIMG
jgi:hypothetical protein